MHSKSLQLWMLADMFTPSDDMQHTSQGVSMTKHECSVTMHWMPHSHKPAFSAALHQLQRPNCSATVAFSDCQPRSSSRPKTCNQNSHNNSTQFLCLMLFIARVPGLHFWTTLQLSSDVLRLHKSRHIISVADHGALESGGVFNKRHSHNALPVIVGHRAGVTILRLHHHGSTVLRIVACLKGADQRTA